MAENKQKSANQKIKLLKLMEILKRETNAQNPLTTQQITDRLSEIGISCDRRTLYNDITYLQENEYNIEKTSVSHANAYYIDEREFDTNELKILIDAVQACSFLTEEMTNELVDKISHINSDHFEEIHRSNDANFNTNKHKNTNVLVNINVLKNAIIKNKCVSFKYFGLTARSSYFGGGTEKYYHNDGQPYALEPLALVFRDDNYYLLAYDRAVEGCVRTFRVDRLENVIYCTGKRYSQAAKAKKESDELRKYVTTAFSMYSGRTEEVILSIPFVPDGKGNNANRTVLNPVYDRFGEDTKVLKLTDGGFRVTANVQLSNTFYGWIDQFAGKIRITGPDAAKKGYAEHLAKLIEVNKE